MQVKLVSDGLLRRHRNRKGRGGESKKRAPGFRVEASGAVRTRGAGISPRESAARPESSVKRAAKTADVWESAVCSDCRSTGEEYRTVAAHRPGGPDRIPVPRPRRAPREEGACTSRLQERY